MTWTTERPTEPGWYWFEVGNDSPARMTRNIRAIVLVGEDPLYTPPRLRVQFPQGTFHVGRMGGRWAGPIPQPEEPSNEN